VSFKPQLKTKVRHTVLSEKPKCVDVTSTVYVIPHMTGIHTSRNGKIWPDSM